MTSVFPGIGHYWEGTVSGSSAVYTLSILFFILGIHKLVSNFEDSSHILRREHGG